MDNTSQRETLIELRHIHKIYYLGGEEVRANDDISLKIDRGEFVAIVGKSGSGKSTLMNIIGALDVPTDGEYLLGGEDVGIMDDKQLARIRNKMIGFIFQQYNLLPKLNILENVELPLLYAGVGNAERRERAMASLEKVGLSEKWKNMPNQLSGGQQQRVLIARALCATRELLILDEPITGLDPMAIQDFYSMIRKLNREDKVAIIMVSHDLRNAVEEANKILHLQKQVLFYGPAHDYMNSKAAGHFFHEKEQGECLPTAACHMAKNGDGLENNEQKCSCGHTHAHSHQKIEGGNTHERA